ncbi:MAG: 3',5'-cyclic adenosine monophosphate phosphodiesterase CpdA [Candidatus Anoxychlamydiales bacterium]|nr:3',5'-cyclic adenosine monophosphate phosphodiesterase CpdA [Candidatus Anoxychlamydiales bacterium]
MQIFAISDLHLSLSNPEKTMEDFGDIWKDYQKKIESNWKKTVTANDLVLVPGDISWAIKLKDALIDLEWLHSLPGKKVIIRGNHDYWWPSFSKLKEAIPPSISFIQNNALSFDDIAIAGARLWDTKEYNFDEYINFVYNPKQKNDLEKDIQKDLSEKIFLREIERLKLSLEKLDTKAKTKIVMTHYPPISADLKDSIVSKLLEKHNIDICIFGHLHNLKAEKKMFGQKNNIKYMLTSADYINFNPIKLL